MLLSVLLRDLRGWVPGTLTRKRSPRLHRPGSRLSTKNLVQVSRISWQVRVSCTHHRYKSFKMFKYDCQVLARSIDAPHPVVGHAAAGALLHGEGSHGVVLDHHPLGGVSAAQRVHRVSVGPTRPPTVVHSPSGLLRCHEARSPEPPTTDQPISQPVIRSPLVG